MFLPKLFCDNGRNETSSSVGERAIAALVWNFVSASVCALLQKQILTIASLYPLSIRIVGDIIRRCGLECAFPKKEDFE